MAEVPCCRDLAFSCGFEARGETDEEALNKSTEHARIAHGVKPEEIAQIRAAIREV